MQAYHDDPPKKGPDSELQWIPTRIVVEPDETHPQNGAIIRCPVCGDQFVHIGVPKILQDQSLTMVGYDYKGVGGPLVKVMPVESGASGSTVQLSMYCETRHEFAYTFSFCHGSTSVRLLARDYGGEIQDRPPELWRD